MPPAATLSEETISRLAPDDATLRSGRELARKKALVRPGVSEDGTWLLAECKGSGKDVYSVTVDLSVDPPRASCTCPSRKLPCKHSLGVMLLYVAGPDSLAKREPPAELVAKREKAAARAARKAAGETKPRKVNVAAQAKKVAAQREGLDLLEKLIVDLVSGGHWFEKSRLERLERQSKQMNDAYLPGALIMLRRLVLLGQREDVSDEERSALAADLFAQLWATVKKGRDYLDNKLAGDETQSEADAVMEELLGKVWQLTELKERGCVRENLVLVELAYERWDDEARGEQLQVSHLVELNAGLVYRAVTYQPLKKGRTVGNRPDQPSYQQAVAVREAAVYPGFINKRIRWESGAEQLLPAEPSPLPAVHAVAAPAFEEPIKAFKQQLKNALAPRDAVFLLRCQMIGRIGDLVVVEDAKGGRLVTADRRKGYSNVANLVRAAGELREQPALLARLFLQPGTDRIVAQPLALLTPKKHLRLGL